MAVGVTTLPTTLPTTDTTVISYTERGYTGTIPTEFGLLTKVTFVDLTLNQLTGLNFASNRTCYRRRSRPNSACSTR